MDSEKSDFITKLALFLIFAAIYYIIRRNTGDYYIRKPLLEIFVVAFLLVSGQTILWVSRYYMPHVTVNGFSGSILNRPVLLKDSYATVWAVFNTGEYLEPFHGRGKLATLVVPASQLNQAGRNYVAKTFVVKVPLKALPPVVYSYIVHSGDYNTSDLYFGKFSEAFLHQNPEVIDYEAIIEKQNSQINLRNDLLENRNDELVEMKKFAEEMSGSKRKWYEALVPRKKEEKEE